MILAKKVRLFPAQEQERQLWKSVGTARFIYNWTLNKQEENYKNGGKFISDNDLRKEVTILKQDEVTILKQDEVNEDLTDISLGIDLGVKDLAVCSNGDVYKNINKTYVVRKIEKRLKRKGVCQNKKYYKT